MTNGLDALSNRGRRAVPPPQHPPKTTQHTQTEPNPAPAASSEVKTPPAQAVSDAELRRQTVYLDDVADEYLENIRAGGRRARIDANKSAVIRLALRHLQASTSIDDVVREISALKDAAAGGPGRRRI